jgi:peptidoglycan-associated lipoprotein
MIFKKSLNFSKNFKIILQIFFISSLFLSACTTTKGLKNNDVDYYGNSLYRNIGDPNDPSSIAYFEQSIGNKIYFDLDDDCLNREAQEIADSQISWILRNQPSKIVIEGHCDERGTTEYNIALSERRAYEVQKYFVKNGVDVRKISIIPYGKERPEVLGSSEETWRLNRRAVIVLE